MNRLATYRIPLLAALACLLWSTPFAVIKMGLQHLTPLAFAGLRFMLAGLLLVPFWAGRNGVWSMVGAQLRSIALLSFFQTALLYGLFFIGLTLVPGALGAIVIGASPLITAVTAHFLMADDAMTGRKTLSIGVGLTGIVLLTLSRNPWTPAGFRELVGIGLLILSSISSAFGNVLVARDRHGLDPVLLNSCQIFLGGLVLFAVSLVAEGRPQLALPPGFYLALLWLAAVSAAAFTLWFYLLKQPGVRVSGLNLWKFLIPVFGAILSWMLLPDESPTVMPVIGMLLVALSIVAYHSRWTAGAGSAPDGAPPTGGSSIRSWFSSTIPRR